MKRRKKQGQIHFKKLTKKQIEDALAKGVKDAKALQPRLDAVFRPDPMDMLKPLY